MWEFLGGKVEPGESCEKALARELAEELGVQVQLGQELTGPHPQGWVLNNNAAMRVFFAELTLGEPHPLQDHSELRWLPLGSDHNASAVLSLEWIPADYPIVEALLAAVHAVG